MFLPVLSLYTFISVPNTSGNGNFKRPPRLLGLYGSVCLNRRKNTRKMFPVRFAAQCP